MDEENVRQSIKKYLTANGWYVSDIVNAGHIGKERFIPDILATKNSKIMTVECKGSIDLEGLVKGIGQCIEQSYYGNNIVCFAVPKDKENQAVPLVSNVSIGGGKIGLFLVGERNKVSLKRNWKEIKPIKLNKTSDINEELIRIVRNPWIGMILLTYINKGINYPYLLLQELRKHKSKFINSIDKTQIYNVLNSLEKDQILESRIRYKNRKSHRNYTLTKSGRLVLANAGKTLDQYAALVKSIPSM